MKLKTYVARDLKEALTQVKQDLGPEAVILSTQTRCLPDKGAGVGRRVAVEVTAAADFGTMADLEPLHEPRGRLGYTAPAVRQLQEDLEEVKGILRQWVRQSGPPAWLLQHRELAILYRVLLKIGLSEQILLGWLNSVQELLARGDQPPLALKRAALKFLQEAVTVTDPWQASKARPRLWTFLGPTGVGKTTTIAKLAVRFALMEKRRVGLITLDNQRLGAHEQLAAYSRLAGLPLLAANNREGLVEAIQKLLDQEIILIDTPGRSPHAKELATELHQLLGGLPDLEHHLLLNATVQEVNLRAVIRGYSVVPITSVIIAKLDESRDISGIFNQVCRRRVPVSYLTTGQRVPDDLEAASPEKIVELLLRRLAPDNDDAATMTSVPAGKVKE